jgi:flagellar protein FliL
VGCFFHLRKAISALENRKPGHEERTMAEENTEEQVPKKSKTPLIIAIAVVVNLIIVGVVMFSKNGKKAPKGEGESEGSAEEESGDEEKGHEKIPGPVMAMDNFIVNVRSDEGGKYLKASIVVELKKEIYKEAFEKWEKLLRNEILIYLGGLNAKDTESVKQKRGMESKIKDILNKRIGKEMITGVYFTEFVTQ